MSRKRRFKICYVDEIDYNVYEVFRDGGIIYVQT